MVAEYDRFDHTAGFVGRFRPLSVRAEARSAVVEESHHPDRGTLSFRAEARSAVVEDSPSSR
jgi:hypothetical protein